MDCITHKTFYRPDEVATIFDVSRRTVYRWIDEGRLTAMKVCGTTVRIERNEVERMAHEIID